MQKPPTSKGSFLYHLRQFHHTHLDPSLNFIIAKGVQGLEILSKTHNLGALSADLLGEGRLIPHQILDDANLQDYPSKIEVDGKVAVLWGPLALVNHDCNARLEYQILDAGAQVRQGKSYNWGLHRRGQAKGRVVAYGEPVEVYYGPCEGESDFECRTCRNGRQ